QCLTWAWQESGNPLYQSRVEETINWILREMVAEDASGEPSGAFGSALDADSEGEEGKFYIWHEGEIDEVLGEKAEVFKKIYDVTPQGNWEGKTILNRSHTPDELEPELEETLTLCREKLLSARAARKRPAWDDKVLADWNGLTITALAEASQVFQTQEWRAAAERAFQFILANMEQDGRLFHSWRRGKRANPATLDDYALLIEAAVALHEASGEESYLKKARDWLDLVERHFLDETGGGYYFTADDTLDVILRSKSIQDNATPSGNGVLLGLFFKIYFLTGEEVYLKRAETVLTAFSGALNRQGFGMPTLLFNSEYQDNAIQIVIIADRANPGVQSLLACAYRHSSPIRTIQVVPDGSLLAKGHPALGKNRVEDKATAYVCRGQSCSLPVTDERALAELLKTPQSIKH
ncbi:MAG: thioredoxin domain-containing protein, partial [Kiloniellales bacterium]|nr:thioredoxin domain-containing protein [Kiloniellales bacterium]